MLRQVLCLGVCFLFGPQFAAGSCPDSDTDLKLWSDAETWTDKKVPDVGSEVTISSGMKVKVNVDADVKTITIETGGLLVWDSQVDTVVRTHFIYIQGTMQIGSETCKFIRKAEIVLKGSINQLSATPGCGQKFICVADGGTLELHGQDKLPWTKMTQTLNKLSEADYTFKHKKSSNQRLDWIQGLRIYEIDADTSEVHAQELFALSGHNAWYIEKGFKEIGPFINSIPDGRIVAVGVNRKLKGSESLDDIYPLLESLGATRIREVDHDDAYAFITIKGDPSSTIEDIDRIGRLRNTARVTMVTSNNQKIEVVSQIKARDYLKTYADVTIYTENSAFPRIDLVDDAQSWETGDKVLFTSTDFDMNQAEVGTVVNCDDCGSNQIRVDVPREFTHWAQLKNGIDYRGEVALLTRNIKIRGEIESDCPQANGNCHHFKYDTFGGHVKANRNFKNVHIEGIELEHMGQQTSLGNYPLHFHMCHDTDDENYPNPPYLRQNSIHHTFARCTTIHGSHGVTVQDNVCYDHIGHGIFLEDGGEKRTLIDGNLVAVTRKGHLIPTDTDFPASFWITNPLTRLRNNVAAGSDGTGVWIIFPYEPTGPSRGLGFMARDEAQYTKFTEINNNLVHSNVLAGFFFDGRIDDTLNRAHANNGYYPRTMPKDPKNDNAEDDPVYINKLTGWKNRHQNGWINGGLFIVKHYSSADSGRGLTFPSSSDQEQFISDSVFAGETDNIGEPSAVWDRQERKYEYYPRSLVTPWDPTCPIQGFIWYDNPTYAERLWFSDFKPTENYTSGAIGFKRFNKAFNSVVSRIKDVRFSFNDPSEGNLVYDGDKTVPGFSELDGDLTATFRDQDGTVTGLSTFQQIVKPGRFETTPDCKLRVNWNMAICPFKFGKLLVKIHRDSPDLGTTNPIMVRDDEPDFPQQFEKFSKFMAILGGSHSYTLHWTKHIPDRFWIWGHGVEKNLFVRVGVCLPKNGDFELSTWVPVRRPTRDLWKSKNSIQELDADTVGDAYFFDSSTGLLFLKFISHQARTDSTTKYCEGWCPYVLITVKSGDRSNGDCRHHAYVDPGNYKKPSSGVMGTDSRDITATSPTAPQGWGAGSQLPFV